MKRAELFQKLKGNTVRCTACSWYCRIAPGYRGVCATRENRNGVLYSLVYGKAIGLHLDPVEKKPLFHFLPGSRLLSFGTLGCNFGCGFCQNWDMSQVNKLLPPDRNTGKELVNLIDRMSVSASPKQIVDMAVTCNADGIAYTYNEPAIFAEFTRDTAKLAKGRGLKNVYVSNGFESTETFMYVREYIDAINIDLKSFRDDSYRKVCKAKITPVLENIRKFFASGIITEVTTLVIPDQNDSSRELSSIASFLAGISADIPWHVSAFYPAYEMLTTPPTPAATLIKAFETGKRAGLRYVYVGNVDDINHSSTYCPECGERLVEREYYDVRIRKLNRKKGSCAACGTALYGVWN